VADRPVGEWLRAVWPPLPVWRRLDLAVAVVAAYTALVVAVDLATEVRLPDWGGASALINALILGVLLNFRNREAYDRWWEARRLWGQLINDSRNLFGKLAALARLPTEARADLGRLVVEFAGALKDRLRGPTKGGHVPLAVHGRLLARLQAERDAGRLTEVDLLVLDPHVRGFMDVCGACERIKGTPVPLSYRALLRHGLVLYLLSTPWLVADRLGWWAVPVVALLAYFLLGVEVTAEGVEEPFGSDGDDLPLAAYCDTIRAAAEQALGPAQSTGTTPPPGPAPPAGIGSTLGPAGGRDVP
jgi:putative membrane protein